MTEHEQRAQRIAVRLDLEDAESALAHLQVRMQRYADSIESIARKLRLNADLEPNADDFNVEQELKTRISPDEFSLLKSSGDTATAYISELRQQRQKVLRIREQDAILSRSLPSSPTAP